MRTFLALTVLALSFASLPASAADPITVTAPNGGESWEVATSNTITWAPYGYDPDVNPSNDVVAYLEKRIGGLYIPVGTIMPSGKASIHWEGELDTYGKYPNPGKYFIRIKNTKTGEWDRSDRAFTITPRTVDVKVNRSNGPVTLSNDQLIALSWKTSADFTSCTAYGVRSSLSEDSYQIDGLSAKGGTMRAYYRTYPGEGARAISISCDKNGEQYRYDSVVVNLRGGPAAGTPAVQILAPNGGEVFDPGVPMNIIYSQTGLKDISVALYKNDQWKYWITKDEPAGGDGKNLVSWIPREHLQGLGESDNAGAIFKIYVTGTKSNGRGYVDDKSDAAFSFTRNSLPSASTTAVKINSFTASPSRVSEQETVVLGWKVEGPVADCALRVGTQLITTGLPATGTYSVVPTTTSTYNLYCNSSLDRIPWTFDSKEVVVTVGRVRESAPTCAVSVSPSIITQGQSTTLTWTSRYANYAILPGGVVGATNGSATYTPKGSTTYTVTFAGIAGKASCSAKVYVAEYSITNGTSGTTGTSGSTQTTGASGTSGGSGSTQTSGTSGSATEESTKIQNAKGFWENEQLSKQLGAVASESGVALDNFITSVFGF